MVRFCQLAIAAADEAVQHAGLDVNQLDPERLGVYVGTGIGGIEEIFAGHADFVAQGWRGLSPFFIPKALTNLAAGHIAMRHNAQGPSLCVSTACASGNHSLGEAWRTIRQGDADVILAGTPIDLYDNKAYGRTRGLEFEVVKNYSDLLSGRATYTIQWANGYSSSETTRRSAWRPLLNMTLDLVSPAARTLATSGCSRNACEMAAGFFVETMMSMS
jgi:hypothetical protein